MRRYILGTAGHVDHGKTELVKALTGRDTDRLREEKERGISIDLGFAPLKLDEETFIGIVDVPGHERFIKNMVAGAGGVDVAMLLVAADEGVMPQTYEHLDVLRSLGISSGVVVISKRDLATKEMISVLGEEIAELVRGTFLEGAPVIETSAKSGFGLDELRKRLKAICSSVEVRDPGGTFRLPIDRVFHKKGIGVVVTGSCYSGTVRIGENLELLPSERRVRVREVQSFNEKRNEGFAGERLAIALQGVKIDEVKRGDTLATPGEFTVSRLLDARFFLTAYSSVELKNRERVRLHHGAREVMGRLVLLDREVVRSGGSAVVQLRLENPIVAGEGDRFVLRKYSPPKVVGGGVILDPNASKHKRYDAVVIEGLLVRERGEPLEKVLRAASRAGLEGLRESNLKPADRKVLFDSGLVVVAEGRIFHKDVLETLAEKVHHIVSSHTREHPLSLGLDKEELKQKVGFPHPTPVFNRVLEALCRWKEIGVRGKWVSLGEGEVPGQVRREVDGLEAVIKGAGLVFLSRGDIEKRWKGEVDLAEALQFLRESGRVLKIGDAGFIHKEALEKCKKVLKDLFDRKSKIKVGDIKSAFSLTRKHAIPLLEFMDESGLTTRVGDTRLKGPKFISDGMSGDR